MATLDKQVGASTDDCRVQWTGAAWQLSLTSWHEDAGYQSATGQKRGSGMRFTNVTIPKGSTIDTAYLTLTASESRAVTVVRSRIKGQDADNPATFSTYANYNGRARTSAVIDWDSIPAWTLDTEYNSPEIKTVIQEIIDRAGWASGNAMVIFWDDHDDRSDHNSQCRRQSYAYDKATTKCPKLHIEYTPPPSALRSYGHIIG